MLYTLDELKSIHPNTIILCDDYHALIFIESITDDALVVGCYEEKEWNETTNIVYYGVWDKKVGQRLADAIYHENWHHIVNGQIEETFTSDEDGVY